MKTVLTADEIYSLVGKHRLNHGSDRDFHLFEPIETFFINEPARKIEALFKVKDLKYYNGEDFGPMQILELHHAILINNMLGVAYGSYYGVHKECLLINLQIKCNKPIFIDRPFSVSITNANYKRNHLHSKAVFGDNAMIFHTECLVIKNNLLSTRLLKNFYQESLLMKTISMPTIS